MNNGDLKISPLCPCTKNRKITTPEKQNASAHSFVNFCHHNLESLRRAAKKVLQHILTSLASSREYPSPTVSVTITVKKGWL